ncbi:sushi, von Willebrand factor type A, EGF and pentraxin domain-containing protein 1-like isoform X5 [Phyllopteryx taeniolatus]|uniref:sushi, von Willebrand factor type A, EGF and pentraxin domain-containing protein 1-like isoform X5 n=1 Tax=Phyllopteryx taeniolatus TaxID=161469 RepID=UPI002AD54708|nr:sushi, von Willebrand factor type A, EGF and pentraxin domain-containing protein 1-like isoform X5 [Phyllopteryx taeniolatus]
MYALQNMRSIVWHIMFLSISLFDTAEVPKRCSAPPQYPSTRFDNNLDTGRKFDSGEKVDYKCAEDLVAYTGSPSVMCVNGTWTTLTLKCEKVVTKCQWEPKPPQCLTPPACQGGCSAPANLDESHANLADDFISRTTFGPGERVRYTCDVGYSPVGGSRYRSCSRGQWTPLLLKCELVECEEPPEVANTERKGTEEAPYKYRSVVVYECRAGTLLGNKAIWCTEDGTWSTPPTCKVSPQKLHVHLQKCPTAPGREVTSDFINTETRSPLAVATVTQWWAPARSPVVTMVSGFPAFPNVDARHGILNGKANMLSDMGCYISKSRTKQRMENYLWTLILCCQVITALHTLNMFLK